MCIISNAIAIEFFQTPPDFDKKILVFTTIQQQQQNR